MRRFAALIAVAWLLGVLSAASFGAIEPVGPPIPGGSWYQGFRAVSDSDHPFDGVLVNMTEGSLENLAAPWAFRSFDDPLQTLSESGFANVAPVSPPTNYKALAQVALGGPSVNALNWSFAFGGESDDPVAFDVALYNGDVIILSGHFDWDGSAWTPRQVSAEGIAGLRVALGSFRPSDPVVPEPAMLAIWSVLGAGAVCASALRRRRRTRWSEESRVAIHQIITRGRTQL